MNPPHVAILLQPGISGITDNQVAFEAYFGVAADYEVSDLSLFDGTKIVDLFDFRDSTIGLILDRYGEVGTNSWNYGDGWAYRNDGFDFGNEGAFVETNWSIIQGAIAGCTDNGSCSATFPLGTYCPSSTPGACSPST